MINVGGIRTRCLPAVIIALALMATACSSTLDSAGDGQDGAPTGSSETGEQEPAAEETTETSIASAGATPQEQDALKAQEAAAAFSECLRVQGMDVGDLPVNANGEPDLAAFIASVDPQDPQVQRAMLACQSQLGGDLGDSLNDFLRSGTFEDALANFSDCVRADGYDVETLTLDSIVSALLSGRTGPDPRGIEGSVDQVLAAALGFDPADVEVLNTIDGCADEVQAGLADLGVGALSGDG